MYLYVAVGFWNKYRVGKGRNDSSTCMYDIFNTDVKELLCSRVMISELYWKSICSNLRDVVICNNVIILK
jgi:hypothetical protein